MKHLEESLQTKVCTYIRLQYPDVIFNSDLSGVKLSKYQAAIAKKQRKAKGMPDLHIYEASRGYHGLFIELKKEGESPYRKDGLLKAGDHLKNQDKMHKMLREKGYCAKFATGFDEAKKIIDWYLRKNDE